MSIVSIEKEDIGKKSIEKSIDLGAQTLVYDILQKTQYVKPIESCTRESTANAVDALKEKEIARLILTGQAKVEDYYITRNEDQYSDSNFNKEYYNLDFFDPVDKVLIEHKYNEGSGFCDTLTISDTGVGLSPERFIGILSIGYSSKRNTNKGALGGFGLGAKSPLATGVDYYTIETCYNGKKMIAICYNHKTDMAIGKFNVETGEENPYSIVTTKSGEEITLYYESCPNLKNYTKIIIPTKRINRDKFIQAIKSQLLYFSNIDFYTIDETGYSTKVDFKARILYNSKNIIISDNNYYSKPHILITKDDESTECVCYGYIDFREMEMEELYSSVGVKCTLRSVIRNKDGEEVVIQEGLSCVPSRESIIWDEHSRNYIIDKFKAVQEEASNLVSEKLKETDLLIWLEKASNVLQNTGSDPILNRLSKIIDKQGISPVFPGNSSIRFYANPSLVFKGCSVNTVTLEYDYSKSKPDIKRVGATSWPTTSDNIYFKDTEYDRMKDFYILKVLSNGTQRFTTVEEKDIEDYLDKTIKYPDKEKSLLKGKAYEDFCNNIYKKAKREVEAVLTEYKKSTNFKKYSEIIVPEEWKTQFKEDKDGNVVEVATYQPSPAELRKLNEQIVVYSPEPNQWFNYNDYPVKWRKQEPKLKDFKAINKPEVYYGGGEDEDKLALASYIAKNQVLSFDLHSQLPIFRLAGGLHKHAKSLKHVKTFFTDITQDNIITMSSYLINWYTGKLIADKIDKFRFLTNFQKFNKDMSDAYIKLNDFMLRNYKELPAFSKGITEEVRQDLLVQCDKIFEMQMFVAGTTDQESIKDKAIELFATDFVKDGKAIRNDIYELLLEVEEYCESIYPLLNEVVFLNKAEENISHEQEQLINEFLGYKNLHNYTLKSVLFVPEVIVEEDVIQEEEQAEIESGF
jgi:hypothetical protein